MRVQEVREFVDCFDAAITKEIVFDQEVERAFIHYLGTHGQLDFYPHFPRPYFRLIARGAFQLQGVEGANTARIVLCRPNIEASLASFVNVVRGYSSSCNDEAGG